jgi:hypothetical protein
MRFIQEFGYTVKVGQDEAHQRWMTENDAALKAAVPAGSNYIGTFAVIVSSEKQAGSYKTLIGFDSYAALDVLAAANKDPNDAYARLLREWSQFLDTNFAAPWSSTMLKDVLDATIWDPKQG